MIQLIQRFSWCSLNNNNNVQTDWMNKTLIYLVFRRLIFTGKFGNNNKGDSRIIYFVIFNNLAFR